MVRKENYNGIPAERILTGIPVKKTVKNGLKKIIKNFLQSSERCYILRLAVTLIALNRKLLKVTRMNRHICVLVKHRVRTGNFVERRSSLRYLTASHCTDNHLTEVRDDGC